MKTSNTIVVQELNLKEYPLFKKGKVREVYDLGEHLLLIASDRISAFDVVLPDGIPWKGRVLTAISCFWFKKIEDLVQHHLVSSNLEDLPENLKKYSQELEGRFLIVKKTKPLPVECIVRGYLVGSGWNEYQKKGTVCGIALPKGLKEASKLPEPIFTPSTKADTGHDENIDEEKMFELIGKETGEKVKDLSLKIYKLAADFALEKGIVIADTKFEFGLDSDSNIILIDEVLTPDSSRFWPVESYKEGSSPPSYDKQFVRDYLNTLDWNKEPPGPKLPEEIIVKTQEKYLEAYRKLTGQSLEKESI